MKKWLILAVLSLAATSVHAKFGVGLSINHWEMAGDDLDATASDMRGQGPFVAPFQVDVDKENISGELEVFYDGMISEALGWGVRAGYWISPKAEGKDSYSILNPYDSGDSAENSATSIPVSVYLRKPFSDGKVSVTGGAGMEFIKAETKFQFHDPADSLNGTFKDNKVAPFIHIGGEYHVHPQFSIGLNLKYLFSAEMDDFKGTPTSTYLNPGEAKLVMINDSPFGEFLDATDNPSASGQRPYKVDFGGLRIGIAARFYFGH